MKTKLLKKIRKRFEILYYPNGSVYYTLGVRFDYYPNGYILLKDNENEYSRTYPIGTGKYQYRYEDALTLAKGRILEITRAKYMKKSLSGKKYEPIKLWHI